MRRYFHFHFRFSFRFRALFITALFAAGACGALAQALLAQPDPNEPLPPPVVQGTQSGTGASSGAGAQNTGAKTQVVAVVGASAVLQATGTGADAGADAGATKHHGVAEFCRTAAHRLEGFFDIHKGDDNTWGRFVLAAIVLALFYLARRLVLPLVFRVVCAAFKRIHLGLVERLIRCLEKPAALFLMVAGVYVAASMFHYSAENAEYPAYLSEGARFLFAATFVWAVVRVVAKLIDFAHDKARARQSQIAAFMPWIRKAAIIVIVVFGALTIMQHILGWPIQTFLAGLGIGGLAFALAAQDTIANIFGAVVVAIDQPFRLGETVQLAGHTGTVEDVGVRSMKLRRPDKALVVIPNKTVASESIVNLSKFTNRRVEQVLGFTYDSTPEQLTAIVADIKALLAAEREVQQNATQVYFRDFSASSLDVWLVYVTNEPDFNKHMELRQRLNLAFMRAAAARGMGFAFPTQTIDLAPSAARALGGK